MTVYLFSVHFPERVFATADALISGHRMSDYGQLLREFLSAVYPATAPDIRIGADWIEGEDLQKALTPAVGGLFRLYSETLEATVYGCPLTLAERTF